MSIRACRIAGKLVSSASDDGVVRLWSFVKAGVIAEGRGHSGAIRSLKFAPDGRQLVSVGDDGAVLVWNVFLDEEEGMGGAPEGR